MIIFFNRKAGDLMDSYKIKYIINSDNIGTIHLKHLPRKNDTLLVENDNYYVDQIRICETEEIFDAIVLLTNKNLQEELNYLIYKADKKINILVENIQQATQLIRKIENHY